MRAAERHGDRDREHGPDPRAEHQQLRSSQLRHHRVSGGEPAHDRDDERKRPPAQPRARGKDRERHDRRRASTDGADALLHFEHALAVEVVAAEPRDRRRSTRLRDEVHPLWLGSR
jgi:hypothetical protein